MSNQKIIHLLALLPVFAFFPAWPWSTFFEAWQSSVGAKVILTIAFLLAAIIMVIFVKTNRKNAEKYIQDVQQGKNKTIIPKYFWSRKP
jgi:protein-S-isoprenylcysteine O-methyltransferase Ste14